MLNFELIIRKLIIIFISEYFNTNKFLKSILSNWLPLFALIVTYIVSAWERYIIQYMYNIYEKKWIFYSCVHKILRK